MHARKIYAPVIRCASDQIGATDFAPHNMKERFGDGRVPERAKLAWCALRTRDRLRRDSDCGLA
jgi:hypothetical protein